MSGLSFLRLKIAPSHALAWGQTAFEAHVSSFHARQAGAYHSLSSQAGVWEPAVEHHD